jgi:glycosyltransferase involved in cell wall biosynthesis
MPTVAALSVAIATRDRPAALLRCLRAVLDADVLPAEIIIVDQSSTTETEETIHRLEPVGCSIIYIHQHASGLSASRNAAIQRFTQPVLAVTDDDCIPDAGWVSGIQSAFNHLLRPAAVTGPVLPYGPELPGTSGVSLRTSMTPQDYRSRAAPWRAGSGANFAASRHCLEQIGMYDERLGAGSPGHAGEDIDMLYRVLRAGGIIRYKPQAVIRHERQTLDRRLASRPRYGHGIGACCALWLARGDLYALVVMTRWIGLRCKLLILALGRRRDGILEEFMVLKGTVQGLLYGWRVRARPAAYSCACSEAGIDSGFSVSDL